MGRQPPIRLYYGDNGPQEFWSQGGKDPVQIIRTKPETSWWGATDGTRYVGLRRKTPEAVAGALSRKLGRRVVLSRAFVFAEGGRRLVPRRAGR